MAIELVIFDCDGVLVDSEHIGVSIDLAVLASYGLTMTKLEVIDRFVGRPPDAIARAVEEQLGSSLPDDWLDHYRQLRHDAFTTRLTVVEGVVDALDQIPITACVASSSSHDSVQNKLRITGLDARFEGRIFSIDDVSRGKPYPDLFLHAARRMRVDPARCAVVEDSRPGVLAARSAKMRVFAYAGSVTPPEWLAGPATIVFDTMFDLARLIRERCR